MIGQEIIRNFTDVVTREMIERDIRPWYVAYYSETSEAHLRSCFKGKGLPKIISLIMIAELFECSVNELLGFEFIELKPHDRLFDSGIDTRYIVERLIDQIVQHNLDLHTVEFDDPDDIEDVERCLRLHRLPRTDAFLHICDALKCTPSELLGY